MILETKLFNKIYRFKSVKEVMAKANEEKSGDRLASLAATSAQERVAAKVVLSDLTVNDVFNNPAVPYEQDEVTRIIVDGIDKAEFSKLKNWTIAELREYILDGKTTGEKLLTLSKGLSSEVIASVTKLMSNLDLIAGASKIVVTKTAETTIGRAGCFSSRLQPNHPTDDINGIMASLMEGLSYGAGDAVWGVNPVDDSADSVRRVLDAMEAFRQKWKVPTQTCVLAHVKTQMEAIRKGAYTGLIFQSVSGSEKGNREFGFNASDIAEAMALGLSVTKGKGKNIMYFETGQGSALSSESHYGTDQLTMEARAYGFSRHFDPFLVNTVVGFIGPEFLYDAKQITRAGLEDHFMGKLHGLSMGCDVCYTNHVKADQNDAENLTVLLASAGINFIMGVPNADDVMLSYQSTGYHETATIRELFGKRPIREYEQWLEKHGIMRDGKLTEIAGDASLFL